MIRGAFARFLGREGRPDSTSPPAIVLGLGNPGHAYKGTRHNMGFRCIDRLVESYRGGVTRSHRLVHTTDGVVDGRRVVLAKPKTYVNDSGRAVTSLLTRFRATAGDLIVVYDEMALPIGKVRVRERGGHGGHNGMKSIIEAVGTQEFVRVRIGIGKPKEGTDDVEYVLGRPDEEERRAIEEGIDRAIGAIAMTLTDGIDRAMNVYN